MPRTISIGAQDFAMLRKNNCFYIDKTSFIREWWENMDSVTLITRPRRFGKTLNMSMLECFFSDRYAGRADLFEGLSVWQEEKYRKMQGTYPLISVSFARVKDRSYEQCISNISLILWQVYQQHYYLAESSKLNEEQKRNFRVTSETLLEAKEDARVVNALNTLSELLYLHTGKKVIILLDEYDTPMQEAYVGGFWGEIVSFIRSFFNAAFKTNPYLDRAIMTGITRVSKESIFSDLNNLEVVTTTSQKYAPVFGFTEEEVFSAMDEMGLGSEQQKEEVKLWYDGFTFGNMPDIYNPWSVINYLDKKKFGTYWANTSSNSLIALQLQQADADIKKQFECLMQGDSIQTTLDEEIIFSQLDESPQAVWGLLLASGYVRIVRVDPSPEGLANGTYTLKLTNGEVMLMFRKMVRQWFGRAGSDYNNFVKALLLGDLDEMNDYMNEVAQEIFSHFDTGIQNSKKSQPERFYHGFVLGLLVELHGKYILRSNRESGFGRYDVMLEPVDQSDDGIIIEFKVRKPRRENSLEDTVAAALQQIEEKQYEKELTARGIPKERIRKYGFAFEGKTVLIDGA